jgi:hypothetical protein
MKKKKEQKSDGMKWLEHMTLFYKVRVKGMLAGSPSLEGGKQGKRESTLCNLRIMGRQSYRGFGVTIKLVLVWA